MIKIAFYNRYTDEVGHHQLINSGRVVKEVAQQLLGMGCSLAMRGDDDGPALVVVFEVIGEGIFYVAVGQCKGSFGGFFFLRFREIGMQVCLAVSGCENPARFVEDTGLKKYGTAIGFAIEPVVIDRGIPGFSLFFTPVGGGVQGIAFGGSATAGGRLSTHCVDLSSWLRCWLGAAAATAA